MNYCSEVFLSRKIFRKPISFALQALLAYAAVLALLYCFQSKLIYHPRQDASVPAGWVRAFHDRAIIKKAPVAGNTTAILFHGNAGAAQDRTWMQDDLAGLGINLVIAEYKGFGWRGGEIDEESLVDDGLALYNEVKESLPTGGRLILIGKSLGSGVVAQVASRAATPPDQLVLITPYHSLVDVATSRLPFLPANLLLKDRFDSAGALASYKGDISILLAENDEVLGVATGRHLKAALGKARVNVLSVPAGHNNWMLSFSTDQWRELIFRDQKLSSPHGKKLSAVDAKLFSIYDRLKDVLPKDLVEFESAAGAIRCLPGLCEKRPDIAREPDWPEISMHSARLKPGGKIYNFECSEGGSADPACDFGKGLISGDEFFFLGDGCVYIIQKFNAYFPHTKTYCETKEGNIERVKQTFYPVGLSFVPTEGIDVFESRESVSLAFVIEPGERIEVIAAEIDETDDFYSRVKKYLIKRSNGDVGWASSEYIGAEQCRTNQPAVCFHGD